MTNNYCAYIRVSTSSVEQINSFESQEFYFKNLKGYEIKKIYADKGITGTSMKKRDAFNEMLHDCGLDVKQIDGKQIYIASKREPLYNYILVKSTSRFARNIMVIDVIRELRKKNVYVIFLDININTSDLNADLSLQIFMTLDESESVSKSSAIKHGKKTAAKRNSLGWSRKVYGYNYDKTTKTVTINNDEANVVKMIFNMYINGDGTKTIANYLNNNKVKTVSGKEWRYEVVSKILKNEKYIGNVVRLRITTNNIFDRDVVLNSEEDYIRIENAIPAIIDKDIFYKAKELMNSKIHFVNGIKIGLKTKIK